jgi:hypothetical protein
MATRLELRKGTRVLYRLTDGTWRDGTLVRGAPNDEEWLLKTRFGDYWVPVTRLRPSGEPQPGH